MGLFSDDWTDYFMQRGYSFSDAVDLGDSAEDVTGVGSPFQVPDRQQHLIRNIEQEWNNSQVQAKSGLQNLFGGNQERQHAITASVKDKQVRANKGEKIEGYEKEDDIVDLLKKQVDVQNELDDDAIEREEDRIAKYQDSIDKLDAGYEEGIGKYNEYQKEYEDYQNRLTEEKKNILDQYGVSEDLYNESVEVARQFSSAPSLVDKEIEATLGDNLRQSIKEKSANRDRYGALGAEAERRQLAQQRGAFAQKRVTEKLREQLARQGNLQGALGTAGQGLGALQSSKAGTAVSLSQLEGNNISNRGALEQIKQGLREKQLNLEGSRDAKIDAEKTRLRQFHLANKYYQTEKYRKAMETRALEQAGRQADQQGVTDGLLHVGKGAVLGGLSGGIPGALVGGATALPGAYNKYQQRRGLGDQYRARSLDPRPSPGLVGQESLCNNSSPNTKQNSI